MPEMEEQISFLCEIYALGRKHLPFKLVSNPGCSQRLCLRLAVDSSDMRFGKLIL